MVSSGEVKKRIDWVDIAKGIGMLLVIFGHGQISQLRGRLYSFHMPLFFICSGLTMHLSENNEQFAKNTKRSFIYLFTNASLVFALYSVLILIFYPEALPEKSFPGMIIERVLVFFGGSGADIRFGPVTIKLLGKPWFLLALFWGRTIFDFLHLKFRKKAIFYTSVVIVSLTGVGLGYIQWLPLSLDIALAIQPFFLMGLLLKKADLEKHVLGACPVSMLVWLVTLIVGVTVTKRHFELAAREYPLYPVCFLCAGAGTVFILCISICLSKYLRYLIWPLKIAGKHSILLFWIHCVDNCYPLSETIYYLTGNDYVNALLNILYDCAVFAAVLLLISLFRKLNTRKNGNN